MKDEKEGEWLDELRSVVDDDGDYIDYVLKTVTLVTKVFKDQQWAWPVVLDKTLRPKYYFDQENGKTDTGHLSREELLDKVGDLVGNRKFRTAGDFKRFADILRGIFGKKARGNEVYRIWKELEDPEDLAEIEDILREMNYL